MRSGRGVSHAFESSTWGRWDSGWYLNIAQHGYQAQWHCGGHSIPPHLPPGNYLCGTVQWFAGYPALLRGVALATPFALGGAALFVSWLMWFIYLAVGWRLLDDARSLTTRVLCLAMLAFAPGAIYFAAIFPMSMMLAGTVTCFYFAYRSAWRWAPVGAFVAGVVAGSSYVTASALVPALLVGIVVSARDRWRPAVAGALGVASGLAAILLLAQAFTGIWDGYFIAQRKYATGSHNPFVNVVHHLQPLWRTPPTRAPLQHATAEQTAYTLGILLLAIVAVGIGAFVNADRPANRLDGPVVVRVATRITALDVTVVVAALAARVTAYSAGQRISSWRSESLVVVAVFALRRWRWPALVVPAIAAAWVASKLAIYFFNYQLV